MQRGWERVVVRYPLIVLVEQGRLSQQGAAKELGLSVRQVRRLVRRYRESSGQVWSIAYQRRHPAPNALPEGVRREILRLRQEYPHWSSPAAADTNHRTRARWRHRGAACCGAFAGGRA